MKQLLIVITFILLGCSGTGLITGAKVNQSYDKFEDAYTVETTETMMINKFDTAVPTVTAQASRTCPGETKCSEGEIVLLLNSNSSTGWKFLNNQDYTLIIDGERIDFGELHRLGEPIYGNSVMELMTTELDYDTFQKLANAEKVEGKLGGFEFEWSYDRRIVFRMLIEELTSTP